jgi:hypothetical protein
MGLMLTRREVMPRPLTMPWADDRLSGSDVRYGSITPNTLAAPSASTRR